MVKSQQATRLYEFGPFRIDTANRLLLRDGKPIPLKPKVVDTLLLLIENSGRVVEKDELIRKLWPDSFVEESNLTQNIYVLRKALDTGEGAESYIETIPRRGYRFAVQVKELPYDFASSGNGQAIPPPTSGARISRTLGLDQFHSSGRAIGYSFLLPVSESRQLSGSKYRSQITCDSSVQITDGTSGRRIHGPGYGQRPDYQEATKHEYVPPFSIAVLHAGLGEKAQTLEWLERAFQDRSLRPVWLKFDPRLDGLRQEAELTYLIRRVGLNH